MDIPIDAKSREFVKPGGYGSHFFARIKAQCLAQIYIDASRPQACEAAGIYKNAQGRKHGGPQDGLMTGSNQMPSTRKNVQMTGKIVKIYATVKQLAGNKRTQKDESIRSARRRRRAI